MGALYFTSINLKKVVRTSLKKKTHLINKIFHLKIDTLMKIKYLKADTKWREIVAKRQCFIDLQSVSYHHGKLPSEMG